MQLFIMRHGQANPMGSIDSERKLTEQGFSEVKVMAKWINEANLSLENIFVSPYVRAQQTANTVLNGLNASPLLTTLDFITPSGNAKDVHNYIDGMSGMSRSQGCEGETIDGMSGMSSNISRTHGCEGETIDGMSGMDEQSLLIVSHMPLVSYLVAELTLGHHSPIFQTAAIAQIDYDVEKMTGKLVKLISPFDLT
mgnify:CR=1 FL=1